MAVRAIQRAAAVAAGLAGLAAAGCGRAPDTAPPPVRATLSDVFETAAVIELGEDPRDSISSPGVFAERPGGGFLLADEHLPRVRSYDEDGRLEAAFGRFGQGPFEFQGVSGVAATSSGRVVVFDSRQDRLTYLTRDLLPDTLVRIAGVARAGVPLGGGVSPDGDLLVSMRLAAERSAGISRFVDRPRRFHRLSGSEVVWSAFRLPFVPRERSYWLSFIWFPFAAAGDSVYVASSLRYPVVILSAAGDSIGEIGAPSASYKPFPVLEPGSLAPGSYPTQLPRLLGGSNTLSRISVLGSRLVLTHGIFRQPTTSDAFAAFGSYHASLDVYDRHTGAKLFEDIPLAEGLRVLGAGRYLYVLEDHGFPPWRIRKLRFREKPPDG